MSREDVIAVAIRLFAIYIAFSILKTVPGAVQLLSADGGGAAAGLYAVVLAVGAALCILLWFFPLSIAKRLLPVMREARSEQAIGAPLALSLGLTLIGAWLLATSLVDASYWIAMLIRSRGVTAATGVPVEWSHEQIADMLATLVQIFLSLWLVLGSSGLQRLIYKFRYGNIVIAQS